MQIPRCYHQGYICMVTVNLFQPFTVPQALYKLICLRLSWYPPGYHRLHHLAMLQLSIATVIALSVFFLVSIFISSHKQSTRNPPGPQADVLIGHARKIPLVDAWEVYEKWTKLYGRLQLSFSSHTRSWQSYKGMSYTCAPWATTF